MTALKICLIICALSVPVVFILIARSKLKKKRKIKSAQTVEEIKAEQVKDVEAEVSVSEFATNKKEFDFGVDNLYSSEDFKSYLNVKQEKTTKPKFKDVDFDQSFMFKDFMERKQSTEKEVRNVTFDNLPPDLQAMIIAGVFDKKHFD